MEKIINGKKVMAQVLGGFQIEELGKKYIICSFDEVIDKKNNLIMIYEVDENENIVSIPDNDPVDAETKSFSGEETATPSEENNMETSTEEPDTNTEAENEDTQAVETEDVPTDAPIFE